MGRSVVNEVCGMLGYGMGGLGELGKDGGEWCVGKGLKGYG